MKKKKKDHDLFPPFFRRWSRVESSPPPTFLLPLPSAPFFFSILGLGEGAA